MRNNKVTEKPRARRKPKRPLTLYPLKFNEVIANVLKVKPVPKPAKREKATTSKDQARILRWLCQRNNPNI